MKANTTLLKLITGDHPQAFNNAIEVFGKPLGNGVSIWDRKYPATLKEIHQAPCILFIKGKLRSPEVDTLAIVGTRRNSSYGKLNTERYSDYFSKRATTVKIYQISVIWWCKNTPNGHRGILQRMT